MPHRTQATFYHKCLCTTALSRQQHVCECRGTSQAQRKAKTGAAALGNVKDWCNNFDLTKPVPVQDLSTLKLVRYALAACLGCLQDANASLPVLH